MIKKLVSTIRPKRIDAVIWSGVLLSLAAVAAPAMMLWDADKDNSGLQSYPTAMAAVVGWLFGLAAIVGGFRNFRKAEVVTGIVSVAFAISLFGWSLELHQLWSPSELGEDCHLSYPSWLSFTGWKSIGFLSGLFLGSAVLLWGLSALLQSMMGPVEAFKRSRFLVALAVLGGAFAVIKNVTDQSEGAGEAVNRLLAGAVVGIVLLGLVVVSVALFMIRNNRFWARLVLSAVVVVFVLLSGVFDVIFARLFGAAFSYASLAFWLAFLSPMVLIGSHVRSAEAEGDNPKSLTVGVWRPSPICGTLAILLLVAGVGFVRLYDLPTLLVCKSQPFAAAKLTRDMSLSDGTQVIGRVGDTAGNQLRIIFSQNSDPSFLKLLDGVPWRFEEIVVENLSPGTDVRPLKQVDVLRIHLKDSKLSGEQLRHLSGQSGVSMVSLDLVWENSSLESSVSTEIDDFGAFRFLRCKSGQLASVIQFLLEHSEIPSSSITVEECETSMEDWDSIVAASQKVTVQMLESSLPAEILEGWNLEPSESLANLYYANRFVAEEIDQSIDLITKLASETDGYFEVAWALNAEDKIGFGCALGLSAEQVGRIVRSPGWENLYFRSKRFYMRGSEIDMETWEHIVNEANGVELAIHDCKFPADVADRTDWERLSKSSLFHIDVSAPRFADGTINTSFVWKLALLTDVNVPKYAKSIVAGFGKNELSPNRELTSAAKHMLDCSRCFWAFGYLPSGVQHGRSPHLSFEKTWMARLEELESKPGDLEANVLSELEKLGFVWHDDNGEPLLWVPKQWSVIMNVIELCPSLKTVWIGGANDSAEFVSDYRFVKGIEALVVPADWNLSTQSPLPVGMDKLKELTVSPHWLAQGKASDFPAVENLVLRGIPDRQAIAVLSKMKMLRKVAVHAFEGDLTLQGAQKTLEASLPGVKIYTRNGGVEFQYLLEIEKQRKRMRAGIHDELFGEENE